MLAIESGTHRIAELEAKIARLYRQVERLQEKCKTIGQDKDGAWYFMLALQSQNLREHAVALDKELSRLIESRFRQLAHY